MRIPMAIIQPLRLTHRRLAKAIRLALVAAALLAPSAAAQRIPDSTMVAHFISVGQGASILLEFSCGAVMIDAGAQDASDTQALVSYLGDFFRRRTDLDSTIKTIFISHNHVDHTRALAEVVRTFKVQNLLENGVRGSEHDPGDAAYRAIAALSDGHGVGPIVVKDGDVDPTFGLTSPEIDPVDCSGTDPTITVLSSYLNENPGWTKADYKNKNNGSLVVRIDFGRSSFLFTGDLEEPAIATLIEFYKGTPLLDADVYHVGHHGSANGTTKELLTAMVKPKMAVISMGTCTRDVGQFNAFKFGHPRADIVNMLKTAVTEQRAKGKRVPIADGVSNFRLTLMRAAVYGTGWDGNIDVEATRGGRYHVNFDTDVAPQSCGQ